VNGRDRIVIIDETFATTSQAYRLTRVYRINDHTVRVRICRDAYQPQSYAVAEVLTPMLTWTDLVTEPVSNWYETTPSQFVKPAPTASTLHPLAEQLIRRARTILNSGRRQRQPRS
jgi:hypothetical protein